MDPTKWIDVIWENGNSVEYLMAICKNCGQPYPSQRVIVVSDEEVNEWNGELKSNDENWKKLRRRTNAIIFLGLLAICPATIITSTIKLSGYYFGAVITVISLVYFVTLTFLIKWSEGKNVQSESIRIKILSKHNEIPADTNLNQVGLEDEDRIKYLLVSPSQYERYKMK